MLFKQKKTPLVTMKIQIKQSFLLSILYYYVRTERKKNETKF